MITIVTTVYNDFVALEKTCESILSQSYDKIHHIIVDSDSNDIPNDWNYLENENVTLIKRKIGIYGGMNEGIRNVKTDYFTIMNCGTIFSSSASLESAILQIKKHKNKGIYIFPAEVDDEGGFKLKTLKTNQRSLHPAHLQHESCIYSSAYGFLHEPNVYSYASDGHFIAMYLLQGNVHYSNEASAFIRYGRGGASDKADFLDKALGHAKLSQFLLWNGRFKSSMWYFLRALKDVYRRYVPKN